MSKPTDDDIVDLCIDWIVELETAEDALRKCRKQFEALSIAMFDKDKRSSN